MTYEEFISLPIFERHLITFIDDESYKAMNEGDKEDRSFSEIIEYILKVNPVAHAAIKTIRAYKKSNEMGIDASVLPFSITQHLELPPNHPQKNTLYAKHPVSDKLYIPIIDFHRYTFNHKFAELIRLLSHLGATHIQVNHIRGYGKEFLTDVNVHAPSAEVGVEGKFSRQNSEKKHLIYTSNLEGNCNPELPDNMAWYKFEPSWNVVAENRLKFGLKDFVINLDYTDDYGVNATLKTKAQKAGFEVTGEFETHEKTSWVFNGTFKNSKK